MSSCWNLNKLKRLYVHTLLFPLYNTVQMVVSVKPPFCYCTLVLSAVMLMYCSGYVLEIQPVSLFQGGSHRVSVSDDKDPFRFRHMIATDSLQVRALASRSILYTVTCSKCNFQSSFRYHQYF